MGRNGLRKVRMEISGNLNWHVPISQNVKVKLPLKDGGESTLLAEKDLA